MASDSLRQVGRYIQKTGKDSDRSLKRAYPIQPRLERTRDVFDAVSEFTMQFDTTDNDSRVLLDLFFTLPPPIRGCKSGCIFTKCEEFTVGSGGHSVTLQHAYLADSISVFVNGNVVPSSQVNEINPESGEVFFNADDGGTVAVCYVYTECPADPVFPNCPALGPTIPGMSVLFSDRFDRTPTLTPYGGSGYWYTNPNLSTPVQLPYTGGAVTLNIVRSYMFSDKRGAAGPNEILLAADLSGLFSSLTISLTHNSAAPEPSVIIEATGKVTMTSVHELITTTTAGYSGNITTIHQSPINVLQKVYIRYLYDGVKYRVKIWPQNETEPEIWMEHTPTLPVTVPPNTESRRIVMSDFVGAIISGSGGFLMAIQHWGGGSSLFGVWNYFGLEDTSWIKDVCYDLDTAGIPPIPGSAFLGVCASYQDTLSEFGTGNNDMTEGEPFYQYKYTWNQFFPDQAYFYGMTQNVVSYDWDLGKGTTAKVSGDVRWFVNGSTETVPGSMTIDLMGFQYGDGQPPNAPLFLAGFSTQALTMPFDTWTRFELEVPILNGKIQWGVKFINEPVALADQLGDHTGTLFLPRTAEIMTDFRKLLVEAVMAPSGGGRPFCPDNGSLGSRVSPINETFEGGPSAGFDCDDQDVDFMGSNGTQWNGTLDPGASVVVNGSIKTTFEAHGITEDGSDGRCPYTNGEFNGGRSYTSANSRFFLENSPSSSGHSILSFQFRFADIGNPWVIESTQPGLEYIIGQTRYPSGHLSVLSSAFSPYFAISISDKPEDNAMYFGEVEVSHNLLPNIWYNVYIEMTNTIRGKIWRTGDAIPTEWAAVDGIVYPSGGLSITEAYHSFIDDNFWIEISNLHMEAIEPNVVPGTPPPPAPNPPPPPPPPTEPPPPSGGGGTANVSTIPQLKAALADNANTEIVVQNGTYTVTGASGQGTNALYIGGAYASRTNHVLVRPQTPGGVTFSGSGALMGPLLMFQNGSRFQTWDGFHFANAILNETGTIIFGGDATYAPPHDIIMRNITLESSLHRNAPSDINAHGFYFAHANGRGPYNILIENAYVDGTDAMCLWAAVHGFHGNAAHPPADNITIRNITVHGTLFPFVIWFNESGAQTNNWLIDGATISNAQSYAVRFESTSAHNFVMKNMTSTSSGLGGFYCSFATYPNIPGCTFINNSFN